MKKRVLALLCALITAGTSFNYLPALEVKAADTTGKTYYISSLNGNNSRSGTSEKEAWETLDMLYDLKLNPGDQVLLEKGSQFNDSYIHLVDVHGTKDAPIKIGSYGSGEKPAIHANGQGIWYQDYGRNLDNNNHKKNGYVSSTILLYDVDFVEISDLEITNISDDFEFFKGAAQTVEEQGSERMDRTGVAGIAKDHGTMDHVYLDNLYIHDVDGNIGDKHMDNGGIQMNVMQPDNEEKTGIARYNDIRITNCYIRDVSRAGVCVGYTYQWSKFNGSAISDETAKKYGHTNLLFENNYLKDIGNDGMVAMYAYRPLVQNNVLDRAGADMDVNNGGYASYYGYVCAGIWPWKCKDGIFQYNEAFDMVDNQDGMPWDIDSSDGTIYQYNYSHNNGGGCIMFCAGEAYQGTFRYNISQNDLKGLLVLSGNPKGEIYNNVFYVSGDNGVQIHNGTFFYGTGVMRNNIFYNISTNKDKEKNIPYNKHTWKNNIFYGYDDRMTIPDGNISADPMFENAGTAPTDVLAGGSLHDRTNVYNGYKLKAGSPAINAGERIDDAPKYDFFGNSVGLQPDIGVFESNTAETVLDIQTAKGSLLEIGESEITGIASKMTVKELAENFVYAQDVTFKVLKDGKELSENDIVTSGVKVQISRGNESKEYQIKTALKIQEVVGSSLEIGAASISNVPLNTTVKELTDNLICAQDVELKVVKNGQEMKNEDIVTSEMAVKISKGSETKEYEIEVVEEYVEDNRVFEEYDPGTMTATVGDRNSEDEGADKLLDNDLNTIWHTNYNGCPQENVWIELDLGEVKPVAMVKYVSRATGGPNGVFEDYEVLVCSDEAKTWKSVKTGTWKNSAVGSTEYAKFETVNARYVKLLCTKNRTATGGSEGKVFGSASEIRVGYEVTE